MQTFFTSDTHFDDEFAIRYFNRPFKSVDKMNGEIVEKWNSIVTENDTVYHLGDLTLSCSSAESTPMQPPTCPV